MTTTDGDGSVYRQARQASRMTQAHLAGAARLSVRTIRRAEAGHQIGFEARRSICAVLGLEESVATTNQAVRRPMHDEEIVFRVMAIRIFTCTGKGGLHPLLLMTLALSTACMGLTLSVFPLILMPVLLVSMFLMGRRNGLDRAEAIDFVMGRRFLDGSPTEIEDRLDEMHRRGFRGGQKAS